jgi:hypothetical protein
MRGHMITGIIEKCNNVKNNNGENITRKWKGHNNWVKYNLIIEMNPEQKG